MIAGMDFSNACSSDLPTNWLIKNSNLGKYPVLNMKYLACIGVIRVIRSERRKYVALRCVMSVEIPSARYEMWSGRKTYRKPPRKKKRAENSPGV